MSAPLSFLDGRVVLHPGDNRVVLRELADASIDSVVTDPPYALVSIGKRFGKQGSAPVKIPEGGSGAYARAAAGFMGQGWDTGETAFAAEFWAEVLRVLKPGGHVVAFGATRAHHRMWCAIEDAGFEIRDSLLDLFDLDPVVDAFLSTLDLQQRRAFAYILDQLGPGGMLAWIYGTGFPKSHNLDGAWAGWGTALKPAWEPIVLARKPLVGTVADAMLAHGTGALNIDGCRVGDEVRHAAFTSLAPCRGNALGTAGTAEARRGTQGDVKRYEGRWPANVVHDGSEAVEAAFPVAPGQQGVVTGNEPSSPFSNVYGAMLARAGRAVPRPDAGSAARFFYSAKADAEDRAGSKHPTVKRLDLMQWLCRLVTPPGGTVLDPFAGSGTTGEAAFREGFRAVLIEREVEFQADIARRLEFALAGPVARKVARVKARHDDAVSEIGGLFGGDAGALRGGGADRSTESSRTRAADERSDDRAGRAEAVR